MLGEGPVRIIDWCDVRKKLILVAGSSGNIEFGLASAVRGIGSRTTVADIGLSAPSEVFIP